MLVSLHIYELRVGEQKGALESSLQAKESVVEAIQGYLDNLHLVQDLPGLSQGDLASRLTSVNE